MLAAAAVTAAEADGRARRRSSSRQSGRRHHHHHHQHHHSVAGAPFPRSVRAAVMNGGGGATPLEAVAAMTVGDHDANSAGPSARKLSSALVGNSALPRRGQFAVSASLMQAVTAVMQSLVSDGQFAVSVQWRFASWPAQLRPNLGTLTSRSPSHKHTPHPTLPTQPH